MVLDPSRAHGIDEISLHEPAERVACLNAAAGTVETLRVSATFYIGLTGRTDSAKEEGSVGDEDAAVLEIASFPRHDGVRGVHPGPHAWRAWNDETEHQDEGTCLRSRSHGTSAARGSPPAPYQVHRPQDRQHHERPREDHEEREIGVCASEGPTPP